jgi:hypothetical protein
MFEGFFRVHGKGANGGPVILSKVGKDYKVAGGTLRIVGLSDLGRAENRGEGVYYDGCHQEDRDNYIDIILVGDQATAPNVTFVEIPGLKGGYRAFYNPGGPGPEPFAGVLYTAPGPPVLEPVVIALDDPMRVSRHASSQGMPPWLLVGVVLLLLAGILIVVGRRRSTLSTGYRTREGQATQSVEGVRSDSSTGDVRGPPEGGAA